MTLVSAITYIKGRIDEFGDAEVPKGQFRHKAWPDLVLAVNPSASVGMKWSMMRDAVTELLDFMSTTSLWQAAQFDVYYMSLEAGSGVVERQNPDP